MASTMDPFSGEEHFKAPAEKVYGVLTDLNALPSAIPGLVSSERIDERSVRCVIKPGLSFLGASVKATMTLAEAKPHSFALMQVAVSGIGMSMKIEARMNIAPETEGRGTKINWTAQVVEMAGLVKAAPPSLVRAAADKVIKDGWEALRQRVETA